MALAASHTFQIKPLAGLGASPLHGEHQPVSQTARPSRPPSIHLARINLPIMLLSTRSGTGPWTSLAPHSALRSKRCRQHLKLWGCGRLHRQTVPPTQKRETWRTICRLARTAVYRCATGWILSLGHLTQWASLINRSLQAGGASSRILLAVQQDWRGHPCDGSYRWGQRMSPSLAPSPDATGFRRTLLGGWQPGNGYQARTGGSSSQSVDGVRGAAANNLRSPHSMPNPSPSTHFE
jgi:hypothetical protein